MYKIYHIFKAGKLFYICFLILITNSGSLFANSLIESVSPPPNSNQQSNRSVLRVKFKSRLDPATINSNTVFAYGERSGRISGEINITSDLKTVYFISNDAFLPGDRIVVILTSDIQTEGGANLQHGYSWSFNIEMLQGNTVFDSTRFSVNVELTAIAAADFNQDGKTDVVVAGVSNNKSYLYFYYYQNQNYRLMQQIRVPYRVRPIKIGDLTQNGYPDLMLVHRGANKYDLNRFTLCYVQPDGQIVVGRSYKVGNGNVEPRGAAIADLNGDGYLDLAVVKRMRLAPNEHTVMVYLNDGSGQVGQRGQPSAEFWQEDNAESIVAADFNQDGYTDLCTTSEGSTGAVISIFMNTGDGKSFSDIPDAFLNMGGDNVDIESAVSADFSGNGRADLLMTDYRSGRIYYFENYETSGNLPVFKPFTSFLAVDASNWLDVGDLDADGDLDAVAIGSHQNRMAILNNNATGDFTDTRYLIVPPDPQLFSIADLNHDGANDIAVADASGVVQVFFNEMNANYPPQQATLVAPLDKSFVNSDVVTLTWNIPGDINNDPLDFLVYVRDLQGTEEIYDSRTSPELFTHSTPIAPSSGTTSMQLNVESTDKQYFWHVEAVDEFSHGLGSDIRSFVFDNAPPTDIIISMPTAQYDGHWFKKSSTLIPINVGYTESNPDSAILTIPELGIQQVITDLGAGTEKHILFQIDAALFTDGQYDFNVRITDRAGNSRTTQSWFGIDTSAPTNTSVTVDDEISPSTTFAVRVNTGTDGQGCGLSGLYDIRVREDDGPWTDWIIKSPVVDTVYTGNQMHEYAFEAIAYDNVGNVEEFTGIPEAVVLVDTTINDNVPPGPPLDIKANDSNPSPWQSGKTFIVTWNIPFDPSGVCKSYYRVATPPKFNRDYHAAADPGGPIGITINNEGITPMWVWLEDCKGNLNFENAAKVYLRRDITDPEILSITLNNPSPTRDNSTRINWYNPAKTSEFTLTVRYTELHTKEIEISAPGLLDAPLVIESPDGENVQQNVIIPIRTATDGVYDLEVTVVDFAGNSTTRTLKLGIDQTAPQNSIASGPETSATKEFDVTWTNGEDPGGSGVAGLFDVYVKVDNQKWNKWLTQFSGNQNTFSGRHGHSYGFEALARDRVGNIEVLNAVPETYVTVDTTFDDTDPPPPPIDLRANGSVGASPWQTTSDFTVSWTIPEDESGVVKSFYKLTTAPASNDDYDGTGSAAGPLNIIVEKEGVTALYVWFADKWNNVDYNHYAQVDLRFDKTNPQINGFVFTDPGVAPNWYSSTHVSTAEYRIDFTETFAESLIVTCEELNYRYVNTTPVSGINSSISSSLGISDAIDGQYDLWAAVVDKAGNIQTKNLALLVDNTPPSGTLAKSPDIASQITFTVTWDGSTDGQGVGLAGLYDIRYRRDSGNWVEWLTEYEGQSVTFDQGEHNHSYDFQVSARDKLDNIESFQGSAETTTLIDTTADDINPPPPPVELSINGVNPSPWQNQPQFLVSLELPDDESGIAGVLYKIDSVPTSNSDFTDSLAVTDRIQVNATKEGGQMVYIWFVDTRGNMDYENNSGILLKYDASPPKIHGLSFENPGYGKDWYNPKTENSARFKINYTERFLDSLFVNNEQLGIDIILADPSNLVNTVETVSINIAEKPDGFYPLRVILVDSAQNRIVGFDSLKLDGTAPDQVKLSSPDTSEYKDFTVTWGGGDDGAGVGINELYDIRVNDNNQGWSIWQENTNKRSALFTGQHKHIYEFQVTTGDFLGNKTWPEQIQGTTFVDTTLVDFWSPETPINLMVDNENPLGWQSSAEFTLIWENPNDVSGIIKAFYKLGSAPNSNADTTGSIVGTPPVRVTATETDGQNCHIWLQDGSLNSDFRNHATVNLLWDPQPPVIDSLYFANPMYQSSWYNPNSVSKATLVSSFKEKNIKTVNISKQGALDSTLNVSSGKETYDLNFDILFDELSDGSHYYYLSLTDSALNVTTDSIELNLDRQPPTGTVAVSPDTSQLETFTVNWNSQPSDSNGSGISDIYDVRVKIDDGEWQPWKTRFQGVEDQFSGEPYHLYAFEAVTYDNVGNRELLSRIAETTTFVDPTFGDNVAPAPPRDLYIQDGQTNGWTRVADVDIFWTNPTDPSGIARCYYKLSSPPTAYNDTTGTADGQPPLRITLEQEGLTRVYVWLVDRSLNVDHRNRDSLLIKYDKTKPVINEKHIMNTVYDNKWINPDSTDSVVIRLNYSELYPDSAWLDTGDILGKIFQTNMSSGLQKWIEYRMPLEQISDGCYPFLHSLTDSAGNIANDSVMVCIDGTPPSGAMALSPDTSLTNTFNISWSGENGGTDSGVGLSGEYDVRIRMGNGAWYPYLTKAKQTSTPYVGIQGYRYSFEVAAWDLAGNREPFLGQAESITIIDTTTTDNVPPPAPLQVRVADQNPSPWQQSSEFIVFWDEPVDPSGINRVYYKLNLPPRSNSDTTGSAPAEESFTVQANKEDGQWLYLWLRDGKGNLDYNHHAGILLRYDRTDPVIDRLETMNAAWQTNWFNQKIQKQMQLEVHYSEKHPKKIIFNSGDAINREIESSFKSGAGQAATVRLPIEFLIDGTYMLVVTLEDSAGNVSEADSIRFYLDSSPPRLVSFSRDTLVSENKECTIQLRANDENGVKSARIQVWLGGSREKQFVDMQANDSGFAGTIPSNMLTPRGIEYRLWISDGVNTIKYPSIDQRPSALMTRVRVLGTNSNGLVSEDALISGSTENSYRMMSIPLVPDAAEPEKVLGDDFDGKDNTKWRAFRWHSELEQYKEYPDFGSLNPGWAFWIITTIKGKRIDTGTGVSTPTHTPYIIPLKRGWNDVGNPFTFSIDWQDIFINSAIDTQLIDGPYTYEGLWILPTDIQVMNPWSGYSIFSRSDDISLTIPALESIGELTKTSPFDLKNKEWVMAVHAEQGQARDIHNYLGAAENATSEKDAGLDLIEPPGVGDYVSLSFVPDQEKFPDKRWTTDFRYPAEGYVYDLEIKSNIEKKSIKLLFKWMSDTRNDIQRILFDPHTHLYMDVRQDSIYHIYPNQPSMVRNFKLYVGSQEFIDRLAIQVYQPTTYSLWQNYPNPFNESTVIVYELVKSSHVDITIYNLLGQVVRKLYSGNQKRGLHPLHWDGKNEKGMRVGSGVYLIKMDTPEYKTTRKMLLLK